MSQSVKQIVLVCVAFLVLAILSLASAQIQQELDPQKDLETIQEIREVLQNLQLLLEVDNETTTVKENARCSCRGLSCQCCQRVRIRKIKIDDDCCFSVTYHRRSWSIRITLTFGRRRIFSKEISARNPPSVCAGIPFLKKAGSVCIQFYNLNIGGRSFTGCARITVSLLFVKIAKINLGCFRINFLNETEPSETMELPYFDSPETMELPYFDVPEVVENNQPLLFKPEVPFEEIDQSMDDQNNDF